MLTGEKMSQVEVKNVRKSRFGSFVALLGVLFAFGAMSAQAQNFLINKKFVNVVGVPNTQVNVLGPGQTSYLEFNMFNSSTGTLVANMTDTLPLVSRATQVSRPSLLTGRERSVRTAAFLVRRR